jgi:hypothetical protein
MCQATLVGLLAIQAGVSSAENASADLRVSARISSICAVSSGPSIVPRREASAARATAQVRCAPGAAYTLSVDMGIARQGLPPLSSTMSARRAEREGDVLVMEIAY